MKEKLKNVSKKNSYLSPSVIRMVYYIYTLHIYVHIYLHIGTHTPAGMHTHSHTVYACSHTHAFS